MCQKQNSTILMNCHCKSKEKTAPYPYLEIQDGWQHGKKDHDHKNAVFFTIVEKFHNNICVTFVPTHHKLIKNKILCRKKGII